MVKNRSWKITRGAAVFVAVSATLCTVNINEAKAEEGWGHAICIAACSSAGFLCEQMVPPTFSFICGLGEDACKEWCDEHFGE